MTVTNTGSTNAPGFTIIVTHDGEAAWHLDPPDNMQNLPNPLGCSTADGTTVLDKAFTMRFFADLVAAQPFGSRQFNHCPKSVSFGTMTSIALAGATIPDVECGSSTDPQAQALTVDTKDLEKAISSTCH